MTVTALILRQADDGALTSALEAIDEQQLPGGTVTVDIDYSSVNYKDGLCLTGQGRLVRTYPHIPGVDFAGRVAESTDPRYRPGDCVVLTGWRVGELHWGGYATKARVNGDWLVPLAAGLTSFTAMAVGTAGLTAMLAIMALEAHGMTPDRGEILITGAAGGVGSMATALLSGLGYRVACVTGRADMAPYLQGLGAHRILPRSALAETVKSPLETESWAGCIDSVGGTTLARLLGQIAYGGSVAAVGLAGGASFPGSVVPFLLRGVNLLGIDSVMQPYDNRIRAWDRIARDLKPGQLDEIVTMIGLAEVVDAGRSILQGGIKGRLVVDVRR